MEEPPAKPAPDGGEDELQNDGDGRRWERVEDAVAKAHQKLLEKGEGVSSFKVVEMALSTLDTVSWSQLGLDMAQIPSLHRLLLLESKVDAFIECFLRSRMIASLYDLHNSICKKEGVQRFEELGLGPLLRHPLVGEHFHVPSNMREIFKVSTKDVVYGLVHFLKLTRGSKFTHDAFLMYMVQRMYAPSKEALGLSLKSLGYYIKCIKAIRRDENSQIDDCVNFMNHVNSHLNKKIVEAYESLAHITLDSSSESISERNEASGSPPPHVSNVYVTPHGSESPPPDSSNVSVGYPHETTPHE